MSLNFLSNLLNNGFGTQGVVELDMAATTKGWVVFPKFMKGLSAGRIGNWPNTYSSEFSKSYVTMWIRSNWDCNACTRQSTSSR